VPGTPVHLGELLYTDGFQGGLYPAGIPVGTIAAAHTARAATQISLSVAPLANLNSLAYVSVVLWEGGS
jgi:cell shape-determining protein MreC